MEVMGIKSGLEGCVRPRLAEGGRKALLTMVRVGW